MVRELWTSRCRASIGPGNVGLNRVEATPVCKQDDAISRERAGGKQTRAQGFLGPGHFDMYRSDLWTLHVDDVHIAKLHEGAILCIA